MIKHKILCTIIPLLLCVIQVTAQVGIDVRIDSLQLLVGEQTGITLDVTCDAKQKVTLPDIKPGNELIPGVEVISVANPDTTLLNSGSRMSIQQKYIITAWDSAFYYLPPFEVIIDTQHLESQSLALKVLTYEVDTLNLDKFFPPHPHMELPFIWEDWRGVTYAFIGMLLLAVAAFIIFDRARKGKPIVRIIRRQKKLPPHEVAMTEINRIKRERKWTEDDSKEYYTQLTDTLRTYIEQRYGFSAMEMTSTEIINQLLEVSDEDSLTELKDIFRTADLVKFAKWNTLMGENDANLLAAMEYINQTKQEPDPNAKPEPEIIKETDKERLTQVRIMRAISMILGISAICLLLWALWRMIDLLV